MNELTDEKLDKVMARLAAESGLDDATANDIASSPQLWWAVQRHIAAEKNNALSPWPPPRTWWRSLAFVGVPTLAAVLVVVGFFILRSNDKTSSLVVQTKVEHPMTFSNPSPELDRAIEPKTVALDNDVKPVGRDLRSRPAVLRARVESRKVPTTRNSTATEEIKSDFIALTYSGNLESGQVVRVKVPSSMMVNLGLVASVEKPSKLVDAEVVVGDDGQTHAIRFIRQ